MRRALALAREGTGATYPNPSVGAVVVAGDEVVGRGRSGPTGRAHAEVVALKEAGARARGSTVFVTLEPCSHHGRTPPCVDAIVDAGVARVHVALVDPAPHVAGQGVKALRKAGVEVEVGLCKRQASEVHAHYLHHVRTGLPFVTLKAAVSLDGRVATAQGHSKWITGEDARRHAHGQRAVHHAVAVGAATVLADDPRLDVRMCEGMDPIRVVFDPRLEIAAAGTFRVLGPGTIFLHSTAAPDERREKARRAGVTTIEVGAASDADGGGLSIRGALAALGAREIRSLLVEGGGRLLGSFVRGGDWQRLCLYSAPVLLGEGRPVFGGYDRERAIASVDEAPRLQRVSVLELGADLLTVYAPLGRSASHGK